MADAFIGEIRAFSFDYVPEGWLPCDGAELRVSQFQALYSVILNRFGGDGTRAFKTPDLRASVAVGAGHGPGLTPRELAHAWGTDTVTLALTDIPAHQHIVDAKFLGAASGLSNTPDNTMMLSRTLRQFDFANINIDPWTVSTGLSPKAISPSGGGQPHENRQPVLALTYCICFDGDYPVRE